MSHIQFTGIDTAEVRRLQRGGCDSNGQTPEKSVSNGAGNPCRHCLEMIKEGEEYLILAHRPFSNLQPYAEVGPVFLHCRECEPYTSCSEDLPPVLEVSPAYMLRGYCHEERIIYGTGSVVEKAGIRDRAKELLDNPDIKFVHVRSATNNCWQARINPSHEQQRPSAGP